MKLRYTIIITIIALIVSIITDAVPGFNPIIQIINSIASAILYVGIWATIFLAIWAVFKKGLTGLKNFIFELIDKIKE